MEEFLVVVTLFVAFPWVLFRGIVAIRKTKSGGRSGGKGGLKASELRAIVEDAVTAATEPLHDRIDTLEGLLMGETPEQAPQRRERLAETLLDDELADSASDPDAPRRRRATA